MHTTAKFSFLMVSRHLQRTHKEQKPLLPRNSINNIFYRNFTISTVARKQEGEGIDHQKKRRAIYNLPHWNKDDVFIWAIEQNISRSDAKILSGNYKPFVKWARGSIEWSDLESKLRAANFTKIPYLLTCATVLEKQLDLAEEEVDLIHDTLDKLIPRNDKAHKYLTDPRLMADSVNKFQPISRFFRDFTKCYHDVDHLFITQRLYEIWKQYYEAAQNPNVKLKWVPSGACGIGKSAIGVMIAATAYFLKKPVFFYPNCRTTLRRGVVLDTLFYWNSELLKTNLDMQKALDTLLLQEESDPSLPKFWEEFSKIPGAVFILDEHQKFYRNSDYKNGYSLYTSFQQFAAAQVVMFIGSSHSKFENTVPDEYKLFLQPLKKEELKHFITAANSPMASLDWSKIPGTTKEDKFNSLYNIFGGVYRLTVELCEVLKRSDGSFDHEATKLACNYLLKLQLALRDLQKRDKQDFITLLKALNQHKSWTQSLTSLAAASIYDKSLLYVTTDGELTAVNKAAQSAIACAVDNLVDFHIEYPTEAFSKPEVILK